MSRAQRGFTAGAVHASQLALVAALVLPALNWAADITTLATQAGAPDRDTRREATYQLSRLGAEAKDALPALIKALADDDKQVWSNAITAIANLGPAAETAIPVLVESMDSRKARGRRQYDRQQTVLRTAFALSRIGTAAVPPLMEALKSDDTPMRVGATKSLAGMQATAKDAIPALVANLGHWDEDLRRETIDALGQIGADAVKPLITALGSSDLKVKSGAAAALGQIGRPASEATEMLLTLAGKDQDPAVRVAALGALPRVGADPEKAVPLLLAAIREGNDQLRHTTTNALFSSRAMSERAVPALVEDLRSSDQATRQRAATVLGRMSSAARVAVPALIESAKKEPDEIAFSTALAQIGSPALDPLLKELTTPGGNAQTRGWIYRALRDMGSPAMEALVPALGASDNTVRAGAIRAMEGMPMPPATARRLQELTGDPDPGVRAATFRTLSTVRSQRDAITPKLEAALSDGSPEVRRAAAAGLAGIGAVGKIGAQGLAELFAEPELATRRAAIEALGSMGAAAAPAVPALTERIKDPVLQSFIVDALAKIGPAAAPAVPQLVELLKSSSEDARVGLLQALGGIGEGLEPVKPVIQDALKSQNRDLRIAAVQAFAKVERDDSKLLPVLTTALQDESGRVRRVAEEAAKQLGPRAEPLVPQLLPLLDRDPERPLVLGVLRAISVRSVPPLLTALNHRDSSVRIFACESLGKLGPGAQEALPQLTKKAESDSDNVRAAAKKAIEQINAAPASS